MYLVISRTLTLRIDPVSAIPVDTAVGCTFTNGRITTQVKDLQIIRVNRHHFVITNMDPLSVTDT